jgi:hypothetical protein
MRCPASCCGAIIVLCVVAFQTALAAGSESRGYVSVTSDCGPTGGAGGSLVGKTASIDNRGIASGPPLCSGWDNISSNVMTYSDYEAAFDGFFDAVTFRVYRNAERDVYVARAGIGAVKNEKGEVIAEGRLQTAENWLAIPGKMGATFRFGANDSSVKAVWSDAKPEDFALLSVNSMHDWTIKDDHFSFLADVKSMFGPTLFIRLPESIVRASVIIVPKGNLELFGFRITARADGAKVRFQKGTVIGCTGCTSKKLESAAAA